MTLVVGSMFLGQACVCANMCLRGAFWALMRLLFLQVEWDTDPGTREVQWVKTYADTGPNEIQSITTTADDVDEVQQLTISANETLEVQVRARHNFANTVTCIVFFSTRGTRVLLRAFISVHTIRGAQFRSKMVYYLQLHPFIATYTRVIFSR